VIIGPAEAEINAHRGQYDQRHFHLMEGQK
jgi:hypothetical protein